MSNFIPNKQILIMTERVLHVSMSRMLIHRFCWKSCHGCLLADSQVNRLGSLLHLSVLVIK